ncbi:hypothetical protein ACI65C_013439 [Semiaphis heraclei]
MKRKERSGPMDTFIQKKVNSVSTVSSTPRIATDGCTVMVSTTKGAVKKVQETAKNALYSPCNNHALNLSLSKSSTQWRTESTSAWVENI